MIGASAGIDNTGSSLTALGYTAAQNNTGKRITAIGRTAGQQNTGDDAIFLGHTAGEYNTADGRLIIDSFDRASEANQQIEAIIHGFMADDHTTQTLRLNAAVGIWGEPDGSADLTLQNGTTPSSINVYNTYTDASNYERLAIKWDADVATIETEAAGTGTERHLRIGSVGGDTLMRAYDTGTGELRDVIGLEAGSPPTLRIYGQANRLKDVIVNPRDEISLSVNNSQKLAIDSNITAYTDVLADSTLVDIGQPTKRFGEGYFRAGIDIGNSSFFISDYALNVSYTCGDPFAIHTGVKFNFTHAGVGVLQPFYINVDGGAIFDLDVGGRLFIADGLGPLDAGVGTIGASVARFPQAFFGSGSAITADAPAIDIAQTYNEAATDFKTVYLDLTNTASNSLKPIKVDVDGSEILSLTSDGTLATSNKVGMLLGGGGFCGMRLDEGNIEFDISDSRRLGITTERVAIRETMAFAISQNSNVVGGDTFLYRDDAGTWAMRDSTQPHALNIYNTYTNASNYERLAIKATGSTYQFRVEAAGTGGVRLLQFIYNGATKLTIGGGVNFYADAFSYSGAELGSDATRWPRAYLSARLDIEGTDSTPIRLATNTAAADGVGQSITWKAAGDDYLGSVRGAFRGGTANSNKVLEFYTGGNSSNPKAVLDGNAVLTLSGSTARVQFDTDNGAIQWTGGGSIQRTSSTFTVYSGNRDFSLTQYNTVATAVVDVIKSERSTGVLELKPYGNTVEQYNSTNPQEFRIYNTWTDDSNYERLAVKWDTNVATIATEAEGTGSKRHLEINANTTTFTTDADGIDLVKLVNPDDTRTVSGWAIGVGQPGNYDGNLLIYQDGSHPSGGVRITDDNDIRAQSIGITGRIGADATSALNHYDPNQQRIYFVDEFLWRSYVWNGSAWDGQDVFRIDPDAIFPPSTETITLGKSTNRFSEGFFQTGIDIGDGTAASLDGIQFNSAGGSHSISVASNILTIAAYAAVVIKDGTTTVFDSGGGSFIAAAVPSCPRGLYLDPINGNYEALVVSGAASQVADLIQIIDSNENLLTTFDATGNLNIYNTWTDGSNYERGGLRWDSNRLELTTEAAGTGTSREIFILVDGTRNVQFESGVNRFEKDIYLIEDTSDPRVLIGDGTATGNWGAIQWNSTTNELHIGHSSTGSGGLVQDIIIDSAGDATFANDILAAADDTQTIGGQTAEFASIYAKDFRSHASYTDGSNYERFAFINTGSAYQFRSDAAGTGVARSMAFVYDGSFILALTDEARFYGNIEVSDDVTYNLGSANDAWLNAYVQTYVIAGTTSTSKLYRSGSTTVRMQANGTQINSFSGTQGFTVNGGLNLGFADGTAINFDTGWARAGAGIIEQLSSPATTPQEYRLYNTKTDASNYERGGLRWNSDLLELFSEAAGTGTGRGIKIVTGSSLIIENGGGEFVRFDNNGNFEWNRNQVGDTAFINFDWSTAGSDAAHLVGGSAGGDFIIRASTASLDAGTECIGLDANSGYVGIGQRDWRANGHEAQLHVYEEVNDAGTDFTTLLVDVTNTASNSLKPIKIDVGGSEVFSVDGDGNTALAAGGDLRFGDNSYRLHLKTNRMMFVADNNEALRIADSGIRLAANTSLSWSSIDDNADGSLQTAIYQESDGVLEQHSSTTAQAFYWYNTRTNPSNYERGGLKWDSNVLWLTQEALGTGSEREIRIGDASSYISINNGVFTFVRSGFAAVSISTQSRFHHNVVPNTSGRSLGVAGTEWGHIYLGNDTAETTDESVIDITQEYNEGTTDFKTLYMDLTNTASNSLKPIKVDVDGSEVFSVAGDGVIETAADRGLKLGNVEYRSAGAGTYAQIRISGTQRFILNSSTLSLGRNDFEFGWPSTTFASTTLDTVLVRDGAADTIAMRRSTNAQEFRLYNTYTDASNYARGKITCQGGNVFRVQAESAGTGPSLLLYLESSSQTHIRVNGATKFYANSAVNVAVASIYSNNDNTLQIGGTTSRFANIYAAQYRNNGTLPPNFTEGLAIATSIVLDADAADTLAQRNGTNPQEFRLYNTYTDASNYERLEIKWDTDECHIRTDNDGTGVSRFLFLGSGANPSLEVQTGKLKSLQKSCF
jgi:hypothetical protein